MMNVFKAMLMMNIKRRLCDGFAVGYNLIFPLLMIGLLGLLCKKISYGGISSFQYYTVTMIPFCIMMAIITAAYAGKDDAYAKTAERVLLAPVSLQVIVWSKVISCSITTYLCSILVYHGICIVNDMGADTVGFIRILFLSLSFAIAAIGTLIGLGMRNFLLFKNIINIPIVLFAIMGGTFFRIGTMDTFGKTVLNLSPIRWVNRSMFQLLYGESNELLLYVSGAMLIVGIICTFLAIKTFKKGEYMNGSLPGYDE